MNRLNETAWAEAQGRVEGDRITNVVVLTAESDNGRTYLAGALEDVAELAEGAQLHADHPDSAGEERSISTLVGTLSNTRVVGNAVRATLNLLDGQFKALVKSIAEQEADGIGLSISARGEVGRRGDRTVVEEVTELFSVDLVTRPATTASLFESLRRRNLEERVEMAETKLLREGVEVTPGARRILEEAAKSGRLEEVAADVRRLLRRGGGGGSGGSRTTPSGPVQFEREPDDNLGIRRNGDGSLSEADIIQAADDIFGA